jgi:Gram-negative bacterial TonB protein C-terminal
MICRISFDYMKSLIISVVIIFSFLLDTAQAQKINDGYYFLNEDWKPAKEKKATYLLRVNTIGDSCKQFNYYHILGPLIRIETFRSNQVTVRQGFFAWYNQSGSADSTGYYENGQPDKLWLYLDSKGALSHSKDYSKGTLVKETDLVEERKKASAKVLRDSANQTVKKDESESEFPGGAHGWLQYLNHHQRYPDRAVNNHVQGEIRTYFVVDTTGKINDPILIKSVEISLDDLALSLITNSPDWIPASKDGRKVKSYKIQPFWYKLDIGKTQ